MKKMMKKTPSKTDDLLKRLGASLRESPLNAHARGAGQTETKTPAPAMEKQMRAQEPAQMNVAQERKEGGQNPVWKGETGRAAQREMAQVAAAVALPWSPPAGVLNENIAAKPVARKTATVMANEKMPESKMSAVEFAQGANEMLLKSAAPLTQEQVASLQTMPAEAKAAVVMKDGLPTAESLKATLEKLGAPMNERQVAQLKELQTMREAIAELKKLQAQAAVPAAKPAAAQWQNYAGGSQRATASGWKTSTIGLYPEDYDKAYELMNYLRAQTGQAVNLSRVIKIALRALEVGPQVLEINEQIRAKDGRLLSRR